MKESMERKNALSNRFIGWNSRVTDKLPLTLASGWYFALRRAQGTPSTGAAE